MILEFSVTNFRSIKEKQTFSMLPEKSIKEHSEAVLQVEKYQALSCALFYGRNASGKSNVIKAFDALMRLVLFSSEYKVGANISQYEPYKLDKKSAQSPVEFKIDFIANDNIRYVYEVSFTASTILKEVLYFYPKIQIAKLFERFEEKGISYGEYFIGKKKEIEALLYTNQLLLAKVGTEKIEKLTQPFLFFSKSFIVYAFHESSYDDALIKMHMKELATNENPHFISNVNKLLRAADTGIDSLLVNEIDFTSFPLLKKIMEKQKEEIKDYYKYNIQTVRKISDNGKTVGEINFLLSEESTGTLKLLGIGGLILKALEIGQTLIIDEFDKSLHPKLTRALINIFMNKKTNPNKAQLIFATHDVSLLDLDLFRRDQIWFVEKEQADNSSFYAVSDIEGVRNNIPLEKWYMSGRLGGTPIINQNELEFQF